MSYPIELVDCLAEVYTLEAELQHRAASVIILRYIIACEKSSDLQDINELLSTIDLDKLGTHSMIALVRSTANVRKLLPSWDATFNQVKTILYSRESDMSMFRFM